MQVVVDAIDFFSDGEDGAFSFSTLETQLEVLLSDGVGGTPSVKIEPSVSRGGEWSDLLVEVSLEWSYMQARQLGLDLAKLTEGADIPSEFKDTLLPSPGSSQYSLGGSE